MDIFEIVKRNKAGEEVSRFHLLRGFALEMQNGEPMRRNPKTGRPYIDRVQPGSVLWDSALTLEPVPHVNRHKEAHTYTQERCRYTDEDCIRLMRTRVRAGRHLLKGGRDR